MAEALTAGLVTGQLNTVVRYVLLFLFGIIALVAFFFGFGSWAAPIFVFLLVLGFGFYATRGQKQQTLGILLVGIVAMIFTYVMQKIALAAMSAGPLTMQSILSSSSSGFTVTDQMMYSIVPFTVLFLVAILAVYYSYIARIKRHARR